MSYHLRFEPRESRHAGFDLTELRSVFVESPHFGEELDHGTYNTFTFTTPEAHTFSVHVINEEPFIELRSDPDIIRYAVKLADDLDADLYGDEDEKYLSDGTAIPSKPASQTTRRPGLFWKSSVDVPAWGWWLIFVISMSVGLMLRKLTG